MFANFLLNDWLSYLERVHPQEIHLGLERIRLVAKHLDLINWKIPVITIAGTNGKGSTVAMLEAIYKANGYQVGAYTSPHLMLFNERIRINQRMIADEELCAAFRVIEEARREIFLTYFETTTLAALWYFKQKKLDVLVLEVGLGGRLDATNIIDPDLAIITTIDFDHQDLLGDTLEKIGYEKAGIIRNKIPVIYADTNPPASVVQQAELLQAKFYCLGVDYNFTQTLDNISLSFGQLNVEFPIPRLYVKSAVAAYIASVCMHAVLPVSSSQLAQAMNSTTLSGRQQVLGHDLKTILDVAHNPQAVELLHKKINNLKPFNKVHAVFSALKDKDLCGLIKPMLSCVDVWYPALLTGARAADQVLLEKAFLALDHAPSGCFESPLIAYQAALRAAVPGDLIIIYGSFYTVKDCFELAKTAQHMSHRE